MATKLDLFNAALLECGHVRLSDTGEAIEAGRVLNDVYTRVVNECLVDADWNFAIETVKLDADTGITPAFGYTEVFAKPSDWLRTTAFSEDEYFAFPLLQYYDDSNFFSADNSPVYVRYVSNDTGLGLDLTRWPAEFTRLVELALANRIVYRLTEDRGLSERLDELYRRQRIKAKNVDAMNEANPKFAPPGSWTSSRWGRLSRGDRGSRGNLTG